MDDFDDAPPRLAVPLRRQIALPLQRYAHFQRTTRILFDSQTLDCGGYCRGTTGRHAEDRFYGPRVHRFLVGAAILNTVNFSYRDDCEIVQASQDSDSDINAVGLGHGGAADSRQVSATFTSLDDFNDAPPTLRLSFLRSDDGTPTAASPPTSNHPKDFSTTRTPCTVASTAVEPLGGTARTISTVLVCIVSSSVPPFLSAWPISPTATTTDLCWVPKT